METIENKFIVVEIKEEKIGDLVLPDSHRQDNKKGIIHSVSANIAEKFPTLQVGKTILYPHNAGVRFSAYEIEFTVLTTNDVIVIL